MRAGSKGPDGGEIGGGMGAGWAGLAKAGGVRHNWPFPRASGGTADALRSGRSVRKGVGVQIPPRAHNEEGPPTLYRGSFFVVRTSRRIWEEPERSGGDGVP